MRKLLPGKEKVFHLHEYAVWEGEDEFYGYMAWDTKAEKISWISGKAIIVGDVFCLTLVTSEGDEEDLQSPQDLASELSKLPKWDKTKYYCVIVGGTRATLIKYCETGEPLKAGEEDLKATEEMLKKNGITLLSG
jgi:hypothetical protein